MKPKLVIFDLDGTLIDSLSVISLTIKDILYKLNLSVEEEKIRALIGLPTEELFGVFIKDVDARDLAIKCFDNIMSDRTGKLKIFPGVKKLLLSIRDLNIKMSIYTNRGRESAKEILELNKIGCFFDLIVGRDDVEKMKPHPEGLLKTLKYFNLGTNEALFIGDSDHDRKSGLGAKIKTHIISSIEEINLSSGSLDRHSAL